MKRFLFDKLVKWKDEKDRKPLIIRGARQVGKTWLMKEFGKNAFSSVAYLNFEQSKNLKNVFDAGFDIPRLITAIEIETNQKINPQNTLIIFDEIQESEGALTSLKYFYENAPEYYIMAAGSLLGVSLHKQRSFPVGKVAFVDLYPLSFGEFLLALNKEPLYNLLQSKDWSLITSFKSTFIEMLKHYYFVGGMPESVKSFAQENDFNQVRQIQEQLLAAYEQDFSKHAPYDIVPRIRMVWKSIPAQLAKENKKFIYGLIKQGARAKEFELAIAWLCDAGLVQKIQRVSKPAIPLIAYQDNSDFKLYLFDVGLLCAMGSIDQKTLINGDELFKEFKGAMTEQYVLQQLICNDTLSVYYWASEKSKAEIDFLIQYKNEIIPIEVKAAENLKARSLKSFYEQYNPSTSIRTSLSDYRKEAWLINVPLYATTNLMAHLPF
ncbi:MAG: ATP-binding protein [Sediminibacterium sp.]